MRPALIAQVAFAGALGALLSSFVATFVSLQTLDVTAGLALRAILVTLVLLVVCWFTVRLHVLSTTRVGLRLGALLGLVLGYAICPTAWSGRAYATQLVAAPGAVTAVLDLVLWLLVGGAVVLVASAPASAHEPATYAQHR